MGHGGCPLCEAEEGGEEVSTQRCSGVSLCILTRPRQIKEGKNTEKANNPYGIANYGASYGQRYDQQYDQQYGQSNAAGDNYYQEKAANEAVWYNDAAAGHSASYNYQVDPQVVTNTFTQYGNNCANSNINYQGGSSYYHDRTDENYRTNVATDIMVEKINGKQKGKKEAKF